MRDWSSAKCHLHATLAFAYAASSGKTAFTPALSSASRNASKSWACTSRTTWSRIARLQSVIVTECKLAMPPLLSAATRRRAQARRAIYPDLIYPPTSCVSEHYGRTNSTTSMKVLIESERTHGTDTSGFVLIARREEMEANQTRCASASHDPLFTVRDA